MPAIGSRVDPMPCGVITTGGKTTGTTITFGTALSSTDYHVSITPTVAQTGTLGEFWITKTVSGFTLKNDGASGLACTYAIQLY